MTLHLTHEQLCDVILAERSLPLEDESTDRELGSDIVQAHLRACPLCFAELTSLRDSLSHFRDASVSYARQEFAESYANRSSIAPPHSYLSQPLYWTAAAVVFVAIIVIVYCMCCQRAKSKDTRPTRDATMIPLSPV